MLFYLDKAKWQKPTGMCVFSGNTRCRKTGHFAGSLCSLVTICNICKIINISKLILSSNEGKHVVCWFKH